MTETKINPTVWLVAEVPVFDQALQPESLENLRFQSYDFAAGDRRFSDLEEACEYARSKSLPWSRQFVRQDPGSYSFQTLWLVQAASRIEVVI